MTEGRAMAEESKEFDTDNKGDAVSQGKGNASG